MKYSDRPTTTTVKNATAAALRLHVLLVRLTFTRGRAIETRATANERDTVH